jgi:hypothetical protein
MEEFKKKVNGLVTPSILANQLNISEKAMWWLVKMCSTDISNTKISKLDYPYTKMLIKTTSKVREVYSPNARVRDIQNMLLRVVWDTIDCGEHSRAYEKGMLLRTPGEDLKGSGVIVGLDFKDFFHSISKKKVSDLLIANGYTPKVADIISTLSCVKDKYSKLPQGGISSAQIANRIAAWLIDPIVNSVCSKYGEYKYVRYSDNIYIGFPKEVTGTTVLSDLRGELNVAGWRNHKPRVMPYYRRQQMLGMVVNTKANAKRSDYKKLLCAMHNVVKCETKEEVTQQILNMAHLGVNISNIGKAYLSLKGKCAYYCTLVNPNVASKLNYYLDRFVEKCKQLQINLQ